MSDNDLIQKGQDDLIRRGDALKAIRLGDTVTKIQARIAAIPAVDADPVCTDCGGSGITYQTERRCACQPSIPAVQPTVKPLRYTEPEGETLEQMRDHARQHPLAQSGDMRLVWVNEGDLHMHTIFHAVQPTVSPDMIEIDIRAVMMERIEEASSQSPWVPPEYAMNEIISDCCSFLREPRDPSPDVAALVEAAEKVINSYWNSTDGVITGIYDLETALARVKGVM